MKANIKEFGERFAKEYTFLYDHHDNVAGFDEAWKAYNVLLKASKSFKDFVVEFVKYRQDAIISDREAAAFMFTMESMGLLN